MDDVHARSTAPENVSQEPLSLIEERTRIEEEPPVGSSSLEPLETSDQRSGRRTHAQSRLHSRWLFERHRIIEALETSFDDDLKRRGQRLDGCCAFPQLHSSSSGKPVLSLQSCRDRMCPRCQHSRGLRAAQQITSLVKTMNAPRFITLTLKHRNASLLLELKRLAECFRMLRRSKFWRSHVLGGVYSIEVTLNQQHGHWHCHMHLIVDGSYIPQKLLSEAWLAATGDSGIVDIRAVHDRERTAKYIATYVAKPADLNRWKYSSLREYASAMHGKRLIHTFGSAHGIEVDRDEEEEKAGSLTPHGSVWKVMKQAALGNERASHAAEIFCRLGSQYVAAAGLLPQPQLAALPPVQAWEISLMFTVFSEVRDAPDEPEISEPPEDAVDPPRFEHAQQLGIEDWSHAPHR